MALNIEVPLELCEYGMNSATTAYASTYQRINFDASNYDGATLYFEIVYTNSNTTTNYNVGLRDVTNSSTKVNVQANMNTTARTRVRSASWSAASGNNVYAVYSPATASTSQVVVHEARIVVVQSNATKTRIQIPLLNRNYNDAAAYNAQYVDNRNTASYGQTTSRYFPIFKYVAAAFDTVPSNGFTLESCVASSNASATASVSLYNKTDNTSVATVTRSSTTPAIVTTSWSAGATNWDDGDAYEIRHQISNASYYSRPGNAYLYITISDLKAYEIYWKISKARTSGTGALINEYQRAQLNPDNYSNESIYFEATGFCSDNGTRVHLNDEGTSESSASGSNVTNADINFNSATKARQRTSNTISPTNGNRFVVDIDSSTNNLELSSAVVVFTYIPTSAKSVSDSGSGSDTIAPAIKTTVTDTKSSANIFSLNRANGTEDGTTTGFGDSVNNCTLSSSTDNAWQGSRSLKAVYSGAWGHHTIDVTGLTSGQSYTVSYYRINPNSRIEFNVKDSSWTIITVETANTAATFTRHSLTFTAPTDGAVKFQWFAQDGADTMYFDGLQLELGSTPTTFALPGSGANASDIVIKRTLLALEDTGSDSEAPTIISRFTLTESATDTESPSLLSKTLVADSESLDDIITLITDTKLTLADSGTGTDLANLANFITSQDSFSTAEYLIHNAFVPLLESATGSDSQLLKIFLSVLETGSSADVFNFINRFTTTDSGAGADAHSLKNISITLDSGSDVETLGLKNAFTLQQSGSGTDSTSLKTFETLLDSLTGVDTATAKAVISQLETTSGTDLLSLTMGVLQTETLTASETTTLQNFLTLLETGTGMDSASTGSSAFTKTDSGTVTEALSLLSQFTLIDSTSGADVPIMKISPFITDKRSNYWTEAVSQMDDPTAMEAGGTTPPTISQSTDYAYEGTQSYKIQWNHIGGGYFTGRVTGKTFVTQSGQGRDVSIWVYAPISFNLTVYITGDHGWGTQNITVGPSWQKIFIPYQNTRGVPTNEYITFMAPSQAYVMYVDKMEAYLSDSAAIINKHTTLDKIGAKNKFSLNQSTGGEPTQSASGWTSINGASLSYDPTNSYFGNGSIKHTNNKGSTQANFEMYTSVSASYFKPNTQYTYTIVTKTDQVGAQLRLHIEKDWYFVVSDSSYFTANDWTVFSFTFTTINGVPRNGYLVFFIQGQNILDGKSVWWDSAQVEEGTSFTSWEFPGAIDSPTVANKFTVPELNSATTEQLSPKVTTQISEAMEDYKRNRCPSNISTGGDTTQNTTGFSCYSGSGTVEYSTNDKVQGSGSIKFTVTANGGLTLSFGSIYNIVPGKEYTLSLWVKGVVTISPNVYLRIGWWTVSNGWISGSNVSKTYDGLWNEWTITATAPTNAFRATFEIYINTGAYTAGDIVHLDKIQFNEGAQITWRPGNILTYNQQSVETDLNGFNKNRGTETLTQVSNPYYIGTKSLEVTTPGSQDLEGVRLNLLSNGIKGNTLYYCGIKVSAPVGEILRFNIPDQGWNNAPNSSVNITGTGNWQEVHLLFKTLPTSNGLYIQLLTANGQIRNISYYWDDAWLLELPDSDLPTVTNRFATSDSATIAELPVPITRFALSDMINKNHCTPNQATGGDVYKNTTDFSPINKCTATYSTEQTINGKGCIKTVSNGAVNADSFIGLGGDAGAFQLRMKAGNTYTVSAWIYVPSATGLNPEDARGLRICFYSLPNGTVNSAKPTVTDEWVKLTVTRTIPLNSNDAFIRLYNGWQTAGKVVYWGEIQVEQNNTATTWVYPGALEVPLLDIGASVLDTGSGSELQTIITKLNPYDALVALDELDIKRTRGVADSGFVDEIITNFVQFSIYEGVTGIDTVIRSFHAYDSGSALDLVSFIKVYLFYELFVETQHQVSVEVYDEVRLEALVELEKLFHGTVDDGFDEELLVDIEKRIQGRILDMGVRL